MKYVITGSLGHISRPVVQELIKAGHEVSVISSSTNKKAEIESLKAKALIGSVEDAGFLTAAFAGADAVYLMIPPNFAPADWPAWMRQVADNYAAAIEKNKVKKVVQLSSIGAHLGQGAGPIDGLAYLENKLKQIPGTDVKALRPSYFYYNLFSMIPLIKQAGIMGSNFGNPDEKLVLVHTDDIAEAAMEELLKLSFTGHSVRYIASDERSVSEIAGVLSEAIGKPGIPWVGFTDEQSFGGMLQAGLSQTIAEGYTQMGKSIREGKVQEDYWKNRPASLGRVKLEDFAKVFAGAFEAEPASV
ncbi:MAG: NAD-dependent dehydratase [Bacteroidetes bacterium]|jgi:uncharacterized protein YbjT (DUF2867 family)|nr:NAD-dependent dehydratase [Bacteroidota bacterium]